MFKRFRLWWLLHARNTVQRKGEGHGYKYVFRRFTFDMSTVSGNFRASVMAGVHPYGYLDESLRQGKESNVFGYIQTLYFISQTLTTDQTLVDDIKKALDDYQERLMSSVKAGDDDDDVPESVILRDEEEIARYAAAPRAERRRMRKAWRSQKPPEEDMGKTEEDEKAPKSGQGRAADGGIGTDFAGDGGKFVAEAEKKGDTPDK